MGIVVTVSMLLGLIILRPSPWRRDVDARQDLRFVTFSASCLAVFGVWNTFWYGLRHLSDFWGWAACVSGVAMIMAAFLVFTERSHPQKGAESLLLSLRGAVIGVLALSFLLYSVTLIQLNLGLPIIGRPAS